MRSSIEIKDLLVYSDIYNLGLTDKDITYLTAVDTTYSGQIQGAFYFKPTSKDYDIALEFSDHTYGTHIPKISIIPRIPSVHTLGYPAFGLQEKAYFKFLPKIADAKKMEMLVKAFHDGYDDNGKRFERTYETLDAFKKAVFEVELGKMRKHYDVTFEFLEACYWAADMPMPAGAPTSLLKKDYESMPAYIQHITHVIQLKDDTRVAFFVKKREWNNYNNRATFELSYNYYMTKPDDVEYNWTDPDKHLSHFDEEKGKPKVIYIDAGATFPRDKEVVDNYRRGQAFITIDNGTLSMLTARWMRKQQELSNEAAAIKSLEGKIKSKIDDLEAGKEFSYNDIIFKKLGFEYENQEVSSGTLSMKKVLNRFVGNYSEEHLNFDRVFDVWLEEAYNHATKAGTITCKVGDIDFDLTVKTSKTKAGVTNQQFRVNGHRINKDEVTAVLAKAICFPTTEDYNQFCDSVSSCSLKYHKILASGIVIKVQDEIFGEETEFKISLERTKNKNYVSFNNKHFKIGDTNKLLTLLNARGMSRVISVLLDEKAVGMKGDDIKLMLETGKKNLEDQRNREKELLESTMKMFNIEYVDDFKAGNGKLLHGYIVRGKLRNYLVEKQKCMVYEYPTGRYICMVDKGQNEHSNVARLVNRFFALSNDSKLAKEISTL